MGEKARFCTECGTPIDSHAKFCPNCGAPQGENGGRTRHSEASYAPLYGGDTPALAQSTTVKTAVAYTPDYTMSADTRAPAAEPQPQPQPPTGGKRPSYRAVGILAAAVLLILVLFLWRPFESGHPIVGKWEPIYGNGYMEFKRDGALVVSSGMQSIRGSYKIISEDRIRIIPPAVYDEEPEEVTFYLEDDVLYIDGTMFQRIS